MADLTLKHAVVQKHATYYLVLTRIGPEDWDTTTFDSRRDAVEYARAWNRQAKEEGR